MALDSLFVLKLPLDPNQPTLLRAERGTRFDHSLIHSHTDMQIIIIYY